jgi:hypothetical protein
MKDSDKHIYLTDPEKYEGVYSQYSRITPKYFADKNANSGKVLGKVLDKETGDYFVGSLSNSYAEIRLLPISDNFSKTSNRYSLPSEDKGTTYINTYVGFFAVNINETSDEKYEILPLVGDSFATFFYGSAPRQLDMAGIVFNTIEDNWRDAFDILYREYARATAAARDNVIAQIKFGDRVVTGHIISMNQQLDAANPAVASFTLKVIVRDVAYTSVENNEQLLKKYSARIKLDDAIKSSKFKTLDSSRLNTIRNFVRTSTLAPPPKMPVAKRASAVNTFNKNCIITTNNDGSNSAVTTNIQADTACSSVDIVNSARARLQNALAAQQKYLNDNKAKGIDPNDPTLKELNSEVKLARQEIAELKSTSEDDVKGAALQKYIQQEAEVVADKKITDEQTITADGTNIFKLKVDGDKVTVETKQAEIIDNILSAKSGDPSAKTTKELDKLQKDNADAIKAANETYNKRIAEEKKQAVNRQLKNSSKINLQNTSTVPVP